MPLSSGYWDGISQGGFYDPYASGKGLRKELQRKGGGQSEGRREGRWERRGREVRKKGRKDRKERKKRGDWDKVAAATMDGKKKKLEANSLSSLLPRFLLPFSCDLTILALGFLRYSIYISPSPHSPTAFPCKTPHCFLFLCFIYTSTKL